MLDLLDTDTESASLIQTWIQIQGSHFYRIWIRNIALYLGRFSRMQFISSIKKYFKKLKKFDLENLLSFYRLYIVEFWYIFIWFHLIQNVDKQDGAVGHGVSVSRGQHSPIQRCWTPVSGINLLKGKEWNISHFFILTMYGSLKTINWSL